MNDSRWWPQHLLLGWLNLVLTAPIIYLYVGLPLVLREQGWSGTDIGLLQLAGLPAMLKFLLATPVDRYRLGRFSYRNWALLLGLFYAGALLVLAMNDLQQTPRLYLFALVLLVNLLGTWVDVPINALAIQIMPTTERARAGAVRSAALSIGAIGGGGLMLLIQARFGWAAPLQIMAVGLLSAAALLPLLGSASRHVDHGLPHEPANWRQWHRYFAEPTRRRWAGLLLCYFPFIGAVWVYLKPMLLDHGFAVERIALLVGVGGGLVSAISSLLAAQLTRKIEATITLPLFAVVNLLAVGALFIILTLGLGPTALSFGATAIAIAMGASGGLLFAQMMQHTRLGLTALDYGIQSSLFIAARTLVPLLAGMLLDRFGYPGMLFAMLAGLSVALLMAWKQRECARWRK